LTKLIIIYLFFNISFLFAVNFSTLENKANHYKNKFKVNCVEDKITDNFGNGFESLYGTRNMRPILHGIAYRGGANNYYHKINKRDNKNPLPIDGLINLSNLGFSESVYLYSVNFDNSMKDVYNIDSTNLLYYSQNSLNNLNEIKEIFKKVKIIIDSVNKGPIYLHCWNGWHQSGMIAALLLIQFCDYTNTKALKYWELNTDGASSGYEKIKKIIKEFKPINEFKIDQNTKELICPCSKIE